MQQPGFNKGPGVSTSLAGFNLSALYAGTWHQVVRMLAVELQLQGNGLLDTGCSLPLVYREKRNGSRRRER